RRIVGHSLLSAVVTDRLGHFWVGTSGGKGMHKIDSSGHVEEFAQPDNALFVQCIDSGNCIIGHTGKGSRLETIRINGRTFPIRMADKVHHNTTLNYKFW